MNYDVAKAWTETFISTARGGWPRMRDRLTQRQEKLLTDLASELSPAQVILMMRSYQMEHVAPNVFEFCSYVRSATASLPDELVAKAYLSNVLAVRLLGDELELLEAVWFPSPQDQVRMAEVRERLEAVLA